MGRYRFKNKTGDYVYYLKWKTASPKASLVIAHGMIEHPERYDHFAKYLNDNNIDVYAIYHIGHGEVAEVLNHMGEGDFDKCISNLNELVELAKRENEKVPVILLGHSMGSMMCQHYITRYRNIDGLILSGSTKSKLLFKAGSVLATVVTALTKEKTKPCKFLYKIAFGMYNSHFKNPRTEFDWLCGNEEIVDKYLANPYCSGICSASFYKNVMTGMATMGEKKRLKNIDKNLPIFIYGGSCDAVADMGKGFYALEKQYKKIGVKKVKLIVYPGLRHEVHNEKNNGPVYCNVVRFADAVIRNGERKA